MTRYSKASLVTDYHPLQQGLGPLLCRDKNNPHWDRLLCVLLFNFALLTTVRLLVIEYGITYFSGESPETKRDRRSDPAFLLSTPRCLYAARSASRQGTEAVRGGLYVEDHSREEPGGESTLLGLRYAGHH